MRISVHTTAARERLRDMERRCTDQGEGIVVYAAMEATKDSKLAIKTTKADPTTGSPWQPAKSPLVVRRHRRDRTTARLRRGLLWLTGTLLGSIVPGTAREGAKLIAQVGVGSRTNPRGGSTADYGPAHQFGTSRLPARPFAGITPATAERVVRFAVRWINEGAK